MYNGRELSGTYLREVLPLASKEEFRRIMGYYNPDIQFLFKKKFHPDIVELKEQLLDEGERVTRTQLQRIEQYADRLFKSFNIDINFQDLSKGTHFWHRINDPRNGTPITTDELRQIFKKAAQKYGSYLGQVNDNYQAILKDMETDINIPFIIKFDKENNELDLVPKTIMRKSNFTDLNKPFLKMETTNHQPYTRHICHLYENPNLTINDYFDLVDALTINTDRIDFVSLKLDGWSLQLTFKGQEFYVARNKNEIINPLSLKQLMDKYNDDRSKQFVFTIAMKDLSKSLSTLGQNQLNIIFNNGRTFLNFEIIHPQSENILEYDDSFLSLHSLITYDNQGNETYRTTNLPFDFSHLDRGQEFKIQVTPKFKLEPLENPEAITSILNDLKSKNDHKSTILYLENLIIQNFCKKNNFPQNNIQKIFQILQSVQGQLKTKDDTKLFQDCIKLVDLIGGLNPIEGLVFEYKGQVYKLTGSYGVLIPIFRIYNKMRYL